MLTAHQQFSSLLHLLLSLTFLSAPRSHKQPLKSNCIIVSPMRVHSKSSGSFYYYPPKPNITVLLPYYFITDTPRPQFVYYIGQRMGLAAPAMFNVHPGATLCSQQQVCQKDFTWCQYTPWATWPPHWPGLPGHVHPWTCTSRTRTSPQPWDEHTRPWTHTTVGHTHLVATNTPTHW